ncbi:MAG: hypothetical protein ACREFG_08175 [Chthoniobacterales bacterium]
MKSYFAYMMTKSAESRPLHRRDEQPDAPRLETSKRKGGRLTKNYKLHLLVYHQTFHDIRDALAREIEIKD